MEPLNSWLYEFDQQIAPEEPPPTNRVLWFRTIFAPGQEKNPKHPQIKGVSIRRPAYLVSAAGIKWDVQSTHNPAIPTYESSGRTCNRIAVIGFLYVNENEPLSYKDSFVSAAGIEPATNGLKGHCSAIELHARLRREFYHGAGGKSTI